MRQIRNRINILVVLVAVFLIWGEALAEEPTITFSRTTIQPGFFILVRVKAPPRAKVILNFLNQTKELYPVVQPGFLGVKALTRPISKTVHWLCRMKTPVDFEGILATSYAVAPGHYACKVKIWDGEHVKVQEQLITVVYRYFAEERITVAKKTWQDSLGEEQRLNDQCLNRNIVARVTQKQVNPLWKGKFIWPIQGRITASYGVKRVVNHIDNGHHAGWDLANVAGTPVRAINRGRVVFVGEMNATGNTVVVYHGLDLFSIYAHLSRILVREGQKLSKGQRLGEVGSTGLSTSPHLHLTIKVGDIPVNPLLVLDQKLRWGK